MRQELDAAAARVLGRGWYLMGEAKDLEQAFARYLGMKHCLGMANGTDAWNSRCVAWMSGPMTR